MLFSSSSQVTTKRLYTESRIYKRNSKIVSIHLKVYFNNRQYRKFARSLKQVVKNLIDHLDINAQVCLEFGYLNVEGMGSKKEYMLEV